MVEGDYCGLVFGCDCLFEEFECCDVCCFEWVVYGSGVVDDDVNVDW